MDFFGDSSCVECGFGGGNRQSAGVPWPEEGRGWLSAWVQRVRLSIHGKCLSERFIKKDTVEGWVPRKGRERRGEVDADDKVPEEGLRWLQEAAHRHELVARGEQEQNLVQECPSEF